LKIGHTISLKNAKYFSDIFISLAHLVIPISLNEEYNLGFFSPKKDQCELCIAFQNAEGEEKEALRMKFQNHRKKKQLSRQEKEADKTRVNKSVIVAVYDLQAVLPTPRGDVSVFYYKSKLNNYNFTISELKTGAT
jgi:hypothetical protein